MSISDWIAVGIGLIWLVFFFLPTKVHEPKNVDLWLGVLLLLTIVAVVITLFGRYK